MLPKANVYRKGRRNVANAHPGFKAVQKKIAKKYGMKRAGAILASASRKASPSAKKANPNLKKVKG
jgi:hypothetical protein